jgi:CHAD domain-containing protein|tara:strand:- start:722 stop:1000 length:279 start_codon:yes stop_codon:yes gene_type:complete
MFQKHQRKKVVIKSFENFRKQLPEKDEHKMTQQYKKLTPKMKKAVDEIFTIMDKKPSDFINTFEKTIKQVSKKHNVPEKNIMSYFEKEMLSI